MIIFISGPMSLGPLERNIRDAMTAANILIKNDFSPFIPHLFSFVEITFPQEYERWLEIDFAFIRISSAVLRLPGLSMGADKETTFARTHGIPVFTTINDLITWRDDKKMRELASDVSRVESAEV